jgi:hypothetical protein
MREEFHGIPCAWLNRVAAWEPAENRPSRVSAQGRYARGERGGESRQGHALFHQGDIMGVVIIVTPNVKANSGQAEYWVANMLAREIEARWPDEIASVKVTQYKES